MIRLMACRDATGQGETIARVLARKNTLFLSATGSGKSLTYLLPTLLWKQARAQRQQGGGAEGSEAGRVVGLTIVVSPLLALIRDQLRNLPAGDE
jgi:superfamily II DNA helicase RecQ